MLGVSIRQVENYISSGCLPSLRHARKTWIPREDLENFLQDKGPRRWGWSAESKRIWKHIQNLENSVETMKLGLGFGSVRPPRTFTELLVLHQQVLQDLLASDWPAHRMAQFADDLATLREEEVHLLCQSKGMNAVVPFFELCRKMILKIERSQDYPGRGLETLHARLMRAKGQVHGLLYAATRLRTPLPAGEARRVLKQVEDRPSLVDEFVASYIAAQPEN
jgi:hypothetical protein